jgi:glycosyltransferase involved in cell wall biosynthesis
MNPPPPLIKITLIGPGIIPIPPPGHGAVEILVWDYYLELTKRGYQVDIINKIRNNDSDQMSPDTPYCRELIEEINSGNYDFVHLHYDCLYHILPFLSCRKKAITSHYPYIDQIIKHPLDGYAQIFPHICDNREHYIFALSKKDLDTFVSRGADPARIFLLLNGSNHNEIQPVPLNEKTAPKKSIYIGKVEPRKMQNKYKDIPNIDFYGKCDDPLFRSLDCYKGEPSRNALMKQLSQYGNLVLLSTGENGTPLVIKEALMAGLPVVTNHYSSNDLNLSLPFIDIIPNEKLDNLEYIQHVIEKNREKQDQQNSIRQYGVSLFSWEFLVTSYLENVQKLSLRTI